MNTHASLVLLLASLAGGCQAYANAANGVLNSGLVDVVDGSVTVKNASSLSVCKITVFSDKEPSREKNDLEGKELLPGGDATVSIPHVGKASEPSPEGTTYGLRAYTCKDRTAYTKEAGALLTTIPKIDPKSTNPIIIH